MKHERAKRFKKTLKFFTINFNFKTPCKIIVDSAFISTANLHKVHIKQNMSKIFDSETLQIFYTNCILDRLQQQFDAQAVKQMIQGLERLQCRHDPFSEEDQSREESCIKAMLNFYQKIQNPPQSMCAGIEKYDLRCSIRASFVGVPTLYLNKQVLTLDSPSKEAMDEVEKIMQARLAVPEEERKIIVQKETLEHQSKKKRKFSEPNPLSVKKPKKLKVEDNKKEEKEKPKKKTRRGKKKKISNAEIVE